MNDMTEKVKQRIKNCINPECSCNGCEYNENGCDEQLMFDALSVIEELQAEIGRLKEQDNCENCAIAIEDRQLVVRCKDCFYAEDFDCPAPLPIGYLCQKGHGSHMGDWFCADGMRKDELQDG